MKVHFFQRYHGKENVDTANAMLLLSRLYEYSSSSFYAFLRKVLPENAVVELILNLQSRSASSVPDATISQQSFRIVVETKLNGNFGLKQLVQHLNSFKNEDFRVLLTLDPNPMKQKTKDELYIVIREHNTKEHSNIIHQHLTFEKLIESIGEVIHERDYEMQDVLDEFKEYCYTSNLIPNDWKRLRVKLASKTIEINRKLNLYYDSIEHGFSGHEYLGLYDQKAVRLIGKIITIVTVVTNGLNLDVTEEKGMLTDEMRENIRIAIEDAKNYGYDLSNSTRYFFVDKFYDTLFEKVTPYPPRGSRLFDLCDVLGVNDLPSTDKIAELLRQKKWE